MLSLDVLAAEEYSYTRRHHHTTADTTAEVDQGRHH